MSLLGAARFAHAWQRGGPAHRERRQALIPPVGQPFEAWVYEPRGRPRATLVTVHSLAPEGVADPRWVRLNRALCATGLRVVAPHFPDVANLRIHMGQVDRVEQALLAVADEPDLCPEGELGLFSVSLSATLSLIAAARPSIAARLRGLCLLGACADAEGALAAATDPAGDRRARLILLANFLQGAAEPRSPLASALFRLARGGGRPLSPAEAQEIQVLLDGAGGELGAERQAPLPVGLSGLSGLAALPGIQAPVTLLHGAADPVFPASESRRLDTALTARGQRSRLLVTPALTHGEAEPLRLRAGEFFAGWSTLAAFLADLRCPVLARA